MSAGGWDERRRSCAWLERGGVEREDGGMEDVPTQTGFVVASAAGWVDGEKGSRCEGRRWGSDPREGHFTKKGTSLTNVPEPCRTSNWISREVTPAARAEAISAATHPDPRRLAADHRGSTHHVMNRGVAHSDECFDVQRKERDGARSEELYTMKGVLNVDSGRVPHT